MKKIALIALIALMAWPVAGRAKVEITRKQDDQTLWLAQMLHSIETEGDGYNGKIISRKDAQETLAMLYALDHKAETHRIGEAMARQWDSGECSTDQQIHKCLSELKAKLKEIK